MNWLDNWNESTFTISPKKSFPCKLHNSKRTVSCLTLYNKVHFRRKRFAFILVLKQDYEINVYRLN